MLLSTAIPFLFTISGVAAAPPVCNKDNLLRCFSATPSPASAYCSSFIQDATVIVASTTPTTTLTATATSTSSTFLTLTTGATTTTTATTDTTTIATGLTTFRTTATVFVTITITSSSTTVVATVTATAAAQKRDLNLRLAARAVAGPACLSINGAASTSYAISRISSACTCIGVAQKTVSATSTAPVVTVSLTTTVPVTNVVTDTTTITSTITSTATNTISSTTSITLSETGTTTGIITTDTTLIQSATTTTTTTGAPTTPTPPCITTEVDPDGYEGQGFKFTQNFSGFRQYLSVNNPGNRDDNYPSQAYSYSTSLSACAILKSCLRTSLTSGYNMVGLIRGNYGSWACYTYKVAVADVKPYIFKDERVVQTFVYIH